ncbi:MAG TPA: hypothetical protein VES02_18800 [Dermatophilaceae bacterium]|nr:hypothetical protein [Dermatophilaceae bacterium]
MRIHVPAWSRRAILQWLAVLCVAGLAWTFRLNMHDRLITSDTLQYTQQALELRGLSVADARTQAVEWYCRARSLSTSAGCIAMNSSAPPDQYSAIFAGRPGWLALAVPFLLVWGPPGMVGLSLLGALALGAAIFAASRELGCGFVAGLCALGVVFVSPAGNYASQVLPEGLTFALIATVGIGAGRIILQRRHGIPVLAASLAGLYLLKSANGAACAIVLAVGTVVLAVQGRSRWPAAVAAAVSLAAVAAAVSLGWFVLAQVAGYPGLKVTLEDLVTRHWTRPPTMDPWQFLLRQNRSKGLPYWEGLVRDPRWSILGLLSFLAVARHRRSWRLAMLWAGLGVSGVALCVAHPIVENWPRFLAPYWVFVGVGAACLITLLATRALKNRQLS